MEKKILKKVSPFLLFLLTIGLAAQGVAQQEVKRNDQDRIERYQRVSQNNTQISNPTYSANVRTPKWTNRNNRNVYAFNGRGNLGRSAYRPRVRTCRPRVVRYGNPIGFRVNYLPQNTIRFKKQGQFFYYNRGDFFVPSRFGYRTIQAPIGARALHLPRRARAVNYGRDVYYQVDGILLAAVTNQRGRVVYEVLGYV